jgi:ubiquinone/menaquinone biosynthesis C-methylase UbiE
LTKQIATIAGQVLGIDVSARSVEIAQQHVQPTTNVTFATGPLEQVLRNTRAEPFTAAVAAMTLMTTPDLSATLRSVADALLVGGHLVAT